MFGPKFEKQLPDFPIFASTINRPIEELERLTGMSVAAPLEMHRGAGGNYIRLADMEQVDARITVVGTGGKYGWRGVFADVTSPGTWLDLPSDVSGSLTADPAYERNGNATLTVGTRIPLKRDRTSNQWLFTYGKCS